MATATQTTRSRHTLRDALRPFLVGPADRAAARRVASYPATRSASSLVVPAGASLTSRGGTTASA